MRVGFRRGLLVGACFALVAAPAEAHLVETRFGDFYGGMLHPLTALDHAVPWLAIGLLAGLQGAVKGRWILLTFPLGLVAGVAAAALLDPWPAVNAVNIASFVVFGVLVAAAWRPPLWALVAIAGVFGVSHGYENGLAMTDKTNASLFIGGVAIVGHILVALVAGATVALAERRRWTPIAVRALGSWVAAIGIMLIGLKVVAR